MLRDSSDLHREIKVIMQRIITSDEMKHCLVMLYCRKPIFNRKEATNHQLYLAISSLVHQDGIMEILCQVSVMYSNNSTWKETWKLKNCKEGSRSFPTLKRRGEDFITSLYDNLPVLKAFFLCSLIALKLM